MRFRRDRHEVRTSWRKTGTPGNPPTPSPVIEAGPTAIDITEISARIAWTVDRFVTGYVHYGLTAAYGSVTTGEASFNYASHIQQLSDLTAATTYHFKVVGADINGLTYDSGDFTFDTIGAVDPIGDLPNIVNPMVFQSLQTAALPSYLGIHSCSHQSGTTEVIRITSSAGRSIGYPSRCLWNADGSMIGLQNSVLRGSDYTSLATGTSAWTWALMWGHTDPNLAFGRDNEVSGVIKKFSVSNSGVRTVLLSANASQVGTGHSHVGFGMAQGEQDNNDRFIAYQWRNSSGAWGIGVWDLQTWSVYAERQLGTGASGNDAATSFIDHTMMSQNGNWMVWQATQGRTGSGADVGVWAYQPDLNTTTRRQLAQSQEHADWCRTAGGSDRFGFWTGGGILSIDPATGNSVNMGPSATGGGTHISGRNWAAPGMIFVGHNRPSDTSPGHNQIYALTVDDPIQNNTRVFAFSHRTQDLGYDSSMFATPSPDGRLVGWQGPWEGNSSNYCYVAGVDVVV